MRKMSQLDTHVEMNSGTPSPSTSAPAASPQSYYFPHRTQRLSGSGPSPYSLESRPRLQSHSTGSSLQSFASTASSASVASQPSSRISYSTAATSHYSPTSSSFPSTSTGQVLQGYHPSSQSVPLYNPPMHPPPPRPALPTYPSHHSLELDRLSQPMSELYYDRIPAPPAPTTQLQSGFALPSYLNGSAKTLAGRRRNAPTSISLPQPLPPRASVSAAQRRVSAPNQYVTNGVPLSAPPTFTHFDHEHIRQGPPHLAPQLLQHPPPPIAPLSLYPTSAMYQQQQPAYPYQYLHSDTLALQNDFSADYAITHADFTVPLPTPQYLPTPVSSIPDRRLSLAMMEGLGQHTPSSDGAFTLNGGLATPLREWLDTTQLGPLVLQPAPLSYDKHQQQLQSLHAIEEQASTWSARQPHEARAW